MENKSLTIVSVIAAGLASLCCIGPLVAVGLGLGAFGAAAFFESVRPYLLVVTVALLGTGFYLTYRKQPQEQCADGTCAVMPPRKSQKLALWLATAIVLPLAAFPYYSALFWADAASASATVFAGKPADGDWTVAVFDHCCPVKSRIESIGWGHRGIRFGSRMAGVPVKRAFFRIA